MVPKPLASPSVAFVGLLRFTKHSGLPRAASSPFTVTFTGLVS